MPITKHNFFVHNVEKLEDTIKKAYKIAKTGRCGPVLIDIPKDVQIAKCEYKGITEECLPEMEKIIEADIEKAVSLIKNTGYFQARQMQAQMLWQINISSLRYPFL